MFDSASRSASGLPIGELVDAIAEESGQIAAAQCRMLLKLAEFDAREDAAFAWDCKSAAHWLSGRCGYDMAASWEMVRVARRLRSLPAITEAFGTGQLNYHSEGAGAHRHARDRGRHGGDGQGRHRLAAGAHRFVLPAGARLLCGCQGCLRGPGAALVLRRGGVLLLQGTPPCRGGDGASPGPGGGGGAAAGGGCAVQRLRRRRRPAARAGTDPCGRQPGGRPRRHGGVVPCPGAGVTGGVRRHPGDRARVRGDPGRDRGGPPGGQHCEIEDGPEIAPETARRLACDAAVVGLVEDASGEVLSMGRKTRKVSPAMARALRCRDKGCVFPGCGQTRFVQAHHITHWAHGGETSLENLTQLCWFHHHLIHEGGFGLARDKESKSLVFSRPDGAVIDKVRIETGPHDGQLGLDVDVGYGAKRTDRIHVEYNDVMRFFSRNDRRIPKLPRGRPPDPEPDPK